MDGEELKALSWLARRFKEIFSPADFAMSCLCCCRPSQGRQKSKRAAAAAAAATDAAAGTAEDVNCNSFAPPSCNRV